MHRLPAIREIARDFTDVDPIQDLIPVQPGQHYSMDGIDMNASGETEVRGLFVAGERAFVSVNGADRLGGNSLLETLIFDKVVAETQWNTPTSPKH
jgi:succinate dehydrogenase / fumarate reductase flavoprotein subunit